MKANLLAIDWDQRRLHVAAVQTSRKGVRVEKTLTWEPGEDLTPASAERLGKQLREFLRAAGVAAGSALVAVSRERVILKEVRFPAVSASEEPALVRFQVGKELTESLDASVIDYARLGAQRVLAVVARRDLVAALQALCRGAGLKLLGIAPRPFGVPYAVERAVPAEAAGDAVRAVLTLGRDWAELGLYRGHEPLLARSLPNGPTLAGEVRRSLAVFAAQHGVESPGVLYALGDSDAALQANLPLEAVSVFTVADGVRPTGEQAGALAGAVGLAELWARGGALPINLAAPKKPQASGDPRKRRWLLLGAAAAVLLLVGVFSMYLVLSQKRATVTALTFQKNDLEERLRKLAQDKVDAEALREWEQTTVPWLDELYDLSARFPHQVGFRLNHLATETTFKKGTKDPHVARLRVSGTVPAGKEALVHQLADAMTGDGHVRAAIEKFRGQEFSVKIDVAKQPRDRYDVLLVAPAGPPRAAAETEDDADAEGGGQ